MSQERLNELVILSLDQNLLEYIEYKSLIRNFAEQTTCKVVIYQWYFILEFFFRSKVSFFTLLQAHKSLGLPLLPRRSYQEITKNVLGHDRKLCLKSVDVIVSHAQGHGCHNPIFTHRIFSGVGTQNGTARTEPAWPNEASPHQVLLDRKSVV